MRLTRNFESRLRMALVLCAAILLVILAVELAMLAGPPSSATAPTAGASRMSPPIAHSRSPDLPPLQDYAVIWRRPLFNPDRRPVPSAGDASLGDRRNGGMALTAVIISKDLRMALLVSGRPETVHRLAVGETLNGWRLTGVTDSSATLRKGAKVRRLEIVLKPSPPAAAAGAVTNPPAPPGNSKSHKLQVDKQPAVVQPAPPTSAKP